MTRVEKATADVSSVLAENVGSARPTAAQRQPPRPPPPTRKKPPPPPCGSAFPLASSKSNLKKNSPAEALLGRRLHWDPLQRNKIEGTVFQELNADAVLTENLTNLIDVNRMKRLFAKSPGNALQRRATIAGILDTKKKIFAGNRGQNIAIALSRLKLSIETIAIEVDAMNPHGLLDRDIIEKIYEIAPTPEELSEYAEFEKSKEDIESLRDVERKYLPLFKARRLREKCRALLCDLRLSELESDATSMLDLLYKGGSEIRKSQKFRALLVAVLLWGNFVNHGVEDTAQSATEEPKVSHSAPQETKDRFGRRTRRAGTAAIEIRTFGFTLPSLLKLAEFKTIVDPTITSLHYIVANMIQSQPKIELHRLCEELESIPKAAKINSSTLKECLSTMRLECEFLKNEVEKKDASDVYGPDAIQTLRDLYETSQKRFTNLNERYQSVTTFVGETAAYFGDVKAKVRADSHEDFFKTLSLFLSKFKACVTDYFQNTRKFQDILIESAQQRGLTYIQGTSDVSANGGPVSCITKPSLVGPVNTRGSIPKSGSMVEAAAHASHQVGQQGRGDSFDVDIRKEPTFTRHNARRASVGAVRKNIVLPAVKKVPLGKLSVPLSRLKDYHPEGAVNCHVATSATPAAHSVNNCQPGFQRGLTRRSTAIGGFYGLPSFKNLDNPQTSEPASHTTASELSEKTTAPTCSTDSSTHLTVPASNESKYVSDSELEPRKTRQYVVEPSDPRRDVSNFNTSCRRSFSGDLNRSNEGNDVPQRYRSGEMDRRVTKKTKEQIANSEAVIRNIGQLLHRLDTRHSTLHSDSISAKPPDVYQALDEAVENFWKAEGMQGRTIESYFRMRTNVSNVSYNFSQEEANSNFF